MRISLFLTALLLAAPLQASALSAGWRYLAGAKPDAALRVFDPALGSSDTAIAREARFGRALSLLLRQPATPAQVEEARQLLTALASGTDEPALGARYQLGRLAQHHLATPDLPEAARQWRELISAQPNSLWAQTALSRLALLELYELPPERPPAERLAAASALLELATLPAAQSELHLALADAILHYRLPPAGALPHLLAAHRLALLDAPTAADVTVQIAEISALTGDTAQAAAFYQKFLDAFPRDQRRFTVTQKLRALPGGR